MNVTIKVGSVVSIPLPAGWSITSGAPAYVSAFAGHQGVFLTGLKAGKCKLTLLIAADLSVSLDVNVVA